MQIWSWRDTSVLLFILGAIFLACKVAGPWTLNHIGMMVEFFIPYN